MKTPDQGGEKKAHPKPDGDALALGENYLPYIRKQRTSIREVISSSSELSLSREISFHYLRKLLTTSAIVPLFFPLLSFDRRTVILNSRLTSLKMLSSVLPFTVKYPARFATKIGVLTVFSSNLA